MASADEHELPERLPVMPLRSTIIFPMGVIGVQIGMAITLEMLAAHPDDTLLLALAVAPGDPDEPIDRHALEKIGVAARLSDRLNLPGGSVRATIQGLRRIRLLEVEETGDHLTARIEPVEETSPPEDIAEELITRTLTAVEALAGEVERVSKESAPILRMNVAEPGRFTDLVATHANFSVRSKDEVVQRLDIEDRLRYVVGELEAQLRRAQQVGEAKRADGAERAEAGPRDRAAAIRQRIKALQSELGEVDPSEREAIELLRRIEIADLPARVASRARDEVEHLRTVRSSVDASEMRSYIDWLLHIPWSRRATAGPDAIDLAGVQQTFDEALLGLEEPKKRMVDYLAVAKLRGDLYGPIPCLVGPPAVGKSTLAAALARALGRPVARLELGGRGEAQLIGTRRTRSGAEPGKIIGEFRDVGVRDPVFVLEEMDQIGRGKVQGDPIEALEEAIEWDERDGFVDRYLDCPFDLGAALFVATAQDFARVPRDLRELMVEIRIASYTPEEKVEIARERLLPRLTTEHGLKPDDIAVDDDALFHLARNYARDPGLGRMLRALGALLRTRARTKADGDTGTWQFTPEKIEEILGSPRYSTTAAESAPEVGVVTGLAWTRAGGEIMFIEALTMPGTGRLIITGRLGDVMRESVNAAYSYVRSRGEELDIAEGAFRDMDVHVHFPVGAIPKDGPSAGIAVTLAVASALSDRPVRHDVAMTGEVTLRGKVLQVGGVKEKVLAAYRAGLREVILPQDNESDLRDVPDDVREKIAFHFVERTDEVIELALRGEHGRGAIEGERAAGAGEPRAASDR